MTIKLYHSSDERIKVGKTLTPVPAQGQNEFTGTLKERCNITDPVITMELSNDVLMKGLDYCYIAEFNRYYFIENITVVQSGLFQLICHVDVLESFKTPIKALSAVISRQEQDEAINPYLNDDKYICNTDPFIATIPFKNSDGTQFKFGTATSWVLSVMGGNEDAD